MKKVISSLTVMFLVGLASMSPAQFLGQVSTAKTQPAGNSLVGGYIGLQDDAFSFFGQYRYGFVQYFDGGLKFGFINLDDKAGVVFGGDLKYQILDDRIGDAFDFSLSGSTEFAGTENRTVFSLGGNVIGSKSFKLRTGKSISPYGKINLRFERDETERPFPFSDRVDTDFDIGGYFGADFEVGKNLSILGEFVFDDKFGFIFGLNYGF